MYSSNKPPKVTTSTSCLYHTTRPRRYLASNGSSSKSQLGLGDSMIVLTIVIVDQLS